MAHNLIKKGYPLVVFDLSQAAVDLAVSRGAQKVSSPAAVAEATSTIITMLPSSPHVRQARGRLQN
jgi:3-hydroxyisobutyrate dehydrogenase-like beta-hydroxyacid dehydrogenase